MYLFCDQLRRAVGLGIWIFNSAHLVSPRLWFQRNATHVRSQALTTNTTTSPPNKLFIFPNFPNKELDKMPNCWEPCTVATKKIHAMEVCLQVNWARFIVCWLSVEFSKYCISARGASFLNAEQKVKMFALYLKVQKDTVFQRHLWFSWYYGDCWWGTVKSSSV